ncbi:hypothetical protein, partial [Xenorhabdus sp. KJ12.1]|uniref:hypothetical protein n=1 Tax=Xenorhabdus sp. KJ12.1 TaxID=1851571 RepID=UPI0019D4D4D2
SKLYMPEDLHDFVFFSKNFDRASGTLVPFLSEAQVMLYLRAYLYPFPSSFELSLLLAKAAYPNHSRLP